MGNLDFGMKGRKQAEVRELGLTKTYRTNELKVRE
jgi:hypothetical protein